MGFKLASVAQKDVELDVAISANWQSDAISIGDTEGDLGSQTISGNETTNIFSITKIG